MKGVPTTAKRTQNVRSQMEGALLIRRSGSSLRYALMRLHSAAAVSRQWASTAGLSTLTSARSSMRGWPSMIVWITLRPERPKSVCPPMFYASNGVSGS